MTVDAMQPDDAPEILRIAAERGAGEVVISPGAHGAVVRDEGKVRAYALIRRQAYGHVIDDLWNECSPRGVRALAIMANWIESTMQTLARSRGEVVSLGGIVRLNNMAHHDALTKRGYEVVGHVLAKDFAP